VSAMSRDINCQQCPASRHSANLLFALTVPAIDGATPTRRRLAAPATVTQHATEPTET
jgi:hypothetical protein